MTDLRELRERIAKLEGPDREVDAEVALGVGAVNSWRWSEPDPVTGEREPLGTRQSDIGANWEVQVSIPRLTASIDAALGLVERVLPGNRGMILETPGQTEATAEFHGDGMPPETYARTLPLAILLALLDAISQNTEAAA